MAPRLIGVSCSNLVQVSVSSLDGAPGRGGALVVMDQLDGALG